ncbi:MAG: hypothetical protein WC785_04605 [Tatlockia sp.]|jgi:hypothetical protein
MINETGNDLEKNATEILAPSYSAFQSLDELVRFIPSLNTDLIAKPKHALCTVSQFIKGLENQYSEEELTSYYKTLISTEWFFSKEEYLNYAIKISEQFLFHTIQPKEKILFQTVIQSIVSSNQNVSDLLIRIHNYPDLLQFALESLPQVMRLTCVVQKNEQKKNLLDCITDSSSTKSLRIVLSLLDELQQVTALLTPYADTNEPLVLSIIKTKFFSSFPDIFSTLQEGAQSALLEQQGAFIKEALKTNQLGMVISLIRSLPKNQRFNALELNLYPQNKEQINNLWHCLENDLEQISALLPLLPEKDQAAALHNANVWRAVTDEKSRYEHYWALLLKQHSLTPQEQMGMRFFNKTTPEEAKNKFAIALNTLGLHLGADAGNLHRLKKECLDVKILLATHSLVSNFASEKNKVVLLDKFGRTCWNNNSQFDSFYLKLAVFIGSCAVISLLTLPAYALLGLGLSAALCGIAGAVFFASLFSYCLWKYTQSDKERVETNRLVNEVVGTGKAYAKHFTKMEPNNCKGELMSDRISTLS